MRYCFYDCVTQEIQKISKPEVRKLNKQYGYKRLQQLQKKKVKCIETDGSSYYVPLSEYNPTKHKFYAAGTLVVFDVLEQRNKKIKVSEYLKNQNQYLTSTKGKVLAKNSDGIQQLVSRKEYETGNYVGQTKGLTTVFDKETGKYTQITCSEFSHNKQRYTGPNFGKVNVINKITGERQQISKLDFDKTIYAGLGDKSQYFLCKNILTGKEKNISIYEWNKLKDLYEIINLQQFEKAKRL